jgi:hypothetical protein
MTVGAEADHVPRYVLSASSSWLDSVLRDHRLEVTAEDFAIIGDESPLCMSCVMAVVKGQLIESWFSIVVVAAAAEPPLVQLALLLDRPVAVAGCLQSRSVSKCVARP